VPRLDNSNHIRVSAWVPRDIYQAFKKIYPYHGASSKFIINSMRRKVLEVDAQAQAVLDSNRDPEVGHGE